MGKEASNDMTREKLESYSSKKEEIEELEYLLKNMHESDAMVGNDTIFDYRTGYPIPQSVVGYDYEKYERMKARYEKRLNQLRVECREVEDFVEGIEDSLTRRIFRMYYIENITLDKIGKKVHLDKSNVSRKIDNFFKVATHATNATL